MTIRHFEVFSVERHSFIIVLMTSLNTVKNKLVNFPVDIDQQQLHDLNNLLNSRFTGLRADEFTRQLLCETEYDGGPAGGIIVLSADFALEVLSEAERTSVYLTGASHIFDYPEYRDVVKAQRLLNYLTDEKEAAHLPVPDEFRGIKVIIGPENTAEELRDASVIVASYDMGGSMRGLVGVVGPTRMDYARVTSRLAYFVRGLGRLLNGGDSSGIGS